MAYFQAKIGWKRLRNRENKNSGSFLLDAMYKISKKIQKKKKYYYGFISSQSRLEKSKKGRKLKFSFHFVPTQRIIENSIKIAKKL